MRYKDAKNLAIQLFFQHKGQKEILIAIQNNDLIVALGEHEPELAKQKIEIKERINDKRLYHAGIDQT